jgi:hypothetical protein
MLNGLTNGSYTISLTQDKVSHEHSERRYLPRSADRSLSHRNVFIKRTDDYRETINEIFKESIEKYNANQPRPERKKSLDYYKTIANGDCHEKPCYEYVLAIGNHETNGVTTPDFDAEHWRALKAGKRFKSASQYVQEHLNRSKQRDKLKQILIDYCRKLPERYPDFHFLSIAIHDDEPCSTCHAHVCFVPIGKGYKQGMDKRISLSKALEQMGYKTNGSNYAVSQWQNDSKDELEKILNEHSFERVFANNTDRHLSLSQYKLKSKNKELSEKNESLENRNKALKFQLQNKKKKQQELDEEAFRARMAIQQLRERETELEEQEKAYKAKYSKLIQREKQIADKLSQIDRREKRLKQRERALHGEEIEERINYNRPLPSIDNEYS